MIEVECEKCEGSGFIEAEKNCTLPASMCCGGCTEMVECPTCDGYGEIEIEEEIYKQIR